jgi:L-ascorbate metabolism protein UlaG (beta-lactamase superfamily)
MLLDPYVTRTKLDDWNAIVEPDLRAIARYTPEHAELIAVSHAHIDHVLDVPSIAWRTGAVVLGTETTARLARAAGLPERDILSAHGGEDIRVGAFQVRVVPALHSAIELHDKPLPEDLRLPIRANEYAEGGTLQYFVRFGGHAIYFVGTANFVEAELHDMRPDIAIVAVGARDKVPNYTCRLLRALGLPSHVLANHFDRWQEPFADGATLVEPGTEADLAAFEAEVHACAPHTRVHVPKHLTAIRF